MLEEGVTDRIKTLLRSDMPPVQFKLLGTLRMMVDGQGKRRFSTPVPGCGTPPTDPGRDNGVGVGRQSSTVGRSGALAPPFTPL